MTDIYGYSMATIAHHLAEVARALGWQVAIRYSPDGDVAAFVIGTPSHVASLYNVDVWTPIEQA